MNLPFSEGAKDPKGMPTLPSKPALLRGDRKNKGAAAPRRELLIVRHGSTKLNSETADRIRGWKDVPLDEKGRKEAEVVGERLKGLVDVIIASDLIRTKETAQIISKVTGAPIAAFTKGARPWNVGVFTGKPTQEVLPYLYKAAKEFPDEKIPEGESFNDFKTRWLSEVQHIETKFPDKRVAIVTHHRNERMYDAWKKKGAKPDMDFDFKIFATKGIPPGNVLIA